MAAGLAVVALVRDLVDVELTWAVVVFGMEMIACKPSKGSVVGSDGIVFHVVEAAGGGHGSSIQSGGDGTEFTCWARVPC